MFRMIRARAMALTFALAAITFSCSHQGTVRDATAEQIADAARKLNGQWTLANYKPELTVLHANMQQLLNDQFGRLVMDVSGNALHARGPGLDFTRTYRITQAYGDQFKATVYDSYGIGSDAACRFEGHTLIVDGLTDPWRGRATFVRVQ